MLPAYQDNRWSCLLFIFYAIMTIYILMSMLLAEVSSKFSGYQKEELNNNKRRRERFLLKIFLELRAVGADFLDRAGMYRFFVTLHNLVEKKKLITFTQQEVEGIEAYFESKKRTGTMTSMSSRGASLAN